MTKDDLDFVGLTIERLYQIMNRFNPNTILQILQSVFPANKGSVGLHESQFTSSE